MRLLALIKKEIISIKNDKRILFVIIASPLMQILIFSFAASLEIKNANIGILNHDKTNFSDELVYALKNANFTKKVYFVKTKNEGKNLIDNQKIIALIHIPNNFYKLKNIQIIADGRHSTTAQVINGYIEMIFQKKLISSSLNLETKILYNPNLNNFWWIVPSLFGSITMVIAIILTALSISKERELGTFDQLLVSPLSSFEILLGKLIPALFISIFISSIVILFALFLFKIPFNGSVLILYFGVVVFLFCICGVGLFISSLSNTQQQAILGSFVFMIPSFLLSGFATPIENMPPWLISFTNFVPLKHYLLLIKGVFLKNISLEIALNYIIPMFLLGILSLSVAMIFFKKNSS